jgi:hypothetical protein
MMVNDKKYAEHSIFLELDLYIDFYSSLSMSVFGFPTMGTSAICNMDTYVYSSIHGTVDSIKILIKNGRINDSYSLLRKYHDSVIINTYSTLYLQDNFSIENFVVEKINNWLHGKDQLPEYRVMSQYIRASEKLKDINSCLYSNNKYKEIRNRCNDHAHYNYFNNLMLNDRDVYIKNRLKSLNKLSEDIRDIFILHLAYIFSLNGHYMMSSDYVDHMDCGVTPPEKSEYWVAPFVQIIFEEVLLVSRSDIAKIIKDNAYTQLSKNHA